MKRCNILMGAYIFFILICFVVRNFVEYPMWGAIVAAVTVSSAFFTYADFFWSNSQSLSDVCDLADEYISDTRKKLNAETYTFEKIHKKIYSIPEGKFDFSEMERVIGTIQQEHNDTENWLNDYVKKTDANRRKVKNYKFISEVFTFVGFLSFLCILVFLPITDKVVQMQDMVSVLAFAVILLSQLSSSIFYEMLKQDKEKVINAKEKYAKCRLQLKEMEGKVEDLVTKIREE